MDTTIARSYARWLPAAVAALLCAPPSARGTPPGAAAPLAGALEAHTRVRAAVSLGPLRWSPTIAAVAQDWARHLCGRARGGRVVLEHRPRNRYGENLFWQGGGGPPSVADAVASWAAERASYDAQSGQCARGAVCGHYTQLVWRATTEVGCAIASCGASHFVVCDYAPPGNVVGQRPY